VDGFDADAFFAVKARQAEILLFPPDQRRRSAAGLFLEQGALDLGQSLPLELLRGLLDLIEGLALLALELVDPLLSARDRVSLVVSWRMRRMWGMGFLSPSSVLIAKQRANSINLLGFAITGKWTGGKIVHLAHAQTSLLLDPKPHFC
jgi:hypothetical protein